MKRNLKAIGGGEEWFLGICGGIAYWLGIPVWLVRLACALLFFAFGATLLIYGLLWLLMPEWDKTPEDYKKVTGD